MRKYNTMPKHKSNKGKYLFIAIVALLIVIVAAFALTQTPAGRKPTASQYFKIVHTASLAENVTGSRNQVLLKTLGINITTVGGDATDVQITIDSQANNLNDIYPSIPNGTTKPAQIELQGYLTTLNGNGLYPVEFDIVCPQADLSVITLYLNPKDIVIL
jgi:hypothetical protein